MSECTVDSVKMWESLASRQRVSDDGFFEGPKMWQKEGRNWQQGRSDLSRDKRAFEMSDSYEGRIGLC